MKKVGIIFLCLLMALYTLTACSRNSSAGEESGSSVDSTAEESQESVPDTAKVSNDDQDPMPEDLIDLTVPEWEPKQRLSDEEIEALDSTQVVWGPGAQVNDQNQPVACVALQEQFDQYDAWFLKGDDKQIYLTFDEGYENGYTPKILDALKEAGVSAVFFITMDYAESEPELVQRMIDEGHVVGNHSVNHKNMTQLSIEEAKSEVMGLHDYVKENFDYEMYLFRNPEGAISEKEMAAVQSVGYQSTLWSFAYADWDPDNQMDPSVALERALGALHPGAVYLLHAVSSTNAAILEDFVAQAQAQGYEFVKWTR